MQNALLYVFYTWICVPGVPGNSPGVRKYNPLSFPPYPNLLKNGATTSGYRFHPTGRQPGIVGGDAPPTWATLHLSWEWEDGPRPRPWANPSVLFASMSKAVKSCTVVGCKNRDKGLHAMPSLEKQKNLWLDFIFNGNVPEHLGKCLLVWSTHLTSDMFINFPQVKRGYASNLRLKTGSIQPSGTRTHPIWKLYVFPC